MAKSRKKPSKQADGKSNSAELRQSPAGLSKFSADNFYKKLVAHISPVDEQKIKRYFKPGEQSKDDFFIGVRMGQVFALAKEFIDMPLPEVEKLLQSPIHELRAGAVSVMDFQARRKGIDEGHKKELFDLYIRRHDRINNWDLVDRAAPYVVGGFLSNKPRDILYKLAVSENVWERRTAIVSTYYFIRKGDIDDTFRIAEILVNDDHDLIQKATGGWIREAGKRSLPTLLKFLDKHAATMPRTALRYAIEHLSPRERKYYMELKSARKK